ncbi:hypothetical protein B5X24_HaOG212330 [Helicoverpa armigera]|nr:hypothetical protein B5X24_HaOG212330 [Helicoverpa armigera]
MPSLHLKPGITVWEKIHETKEIVITVCEEVLTGHRLEADPKIVGEKGSEDDDDEELWPLPMTMYKIHVKMAGGDSPPHLLGPRESVAKSQQEGNRYMSG